MENTIEKKFIIVEFTNCLNENGVADVDVVPNEWIYYDKDEETCKTPYPDPPYDEHTCNLLHARVRNLLPPLSKWPTWPITIKGSGKDYKTAESRLQKLKEEVFAFSTDIDGLSPENKAKEYTKEYRETTLKKLFQVPVIDDNSQQNPKNNDVSFEYTSSDSSSSNTEISKKRISKKMAKQKKHTSPTYSTKKKSLHLKPVSKKSTHITSRKEKENNIQDKLLLMNDEQLLDYAEGCEISLTKTAIINNEETSADREEQIVLNDKSKNNPSEVNNIEENINKVNNDFIFDNNSVHKTKYNFTLEQRLILNAITKIRLSIRNLQSDVNLIKQKLFGYEIGKLEAALKQHNLDIPFNNFDQWVQFEAMIEADKKINDCFVTTIELCLDKVSNNPTKSITNVLKKIMSRELAMQFTAIKKSNNKENIFKNQIAYVPIKQVIMNCHYDSSGKPITEQVFHASLSAAFANVKDWGGRLKN